MNSKWRRTTRTLWRKGSRGGLCLMLLFGLLSAAGGRLAYADATVTTWAELTSAFANAASGSIITLGAGIEQSSDSLSVPSGRSLILDLAGNRLAVHAGSGSTSAAVHVPVGATLTIRDSGVNGTLIADAASGYGAGIGGNYQETAGTIVIDSGNVTATGQSAAGIGGGSFGGSGGTTIINGGNVTALSTGGGAGIGSGIKNGSEGNAGAGGTIMINGGNVSATGTYGGAGIGGAYQSPGANVTITAGVVTVSGSGSGSAIGGTPFGSLYNSGQIQVAGGSQITIPADASVTNNGTISGAISGSEHMGGNNFTISFDWNGVPQSNPASIQIYTTSLAAAGKTLPSLSRAGYIWEGWYTAAEGGEQVTETSTITSSLTLYAHTISDPVPPSVQLMSSVGSGTKGPFMVTAKFSEVVSGFADGDVTVTNGTVGPISGSGDTYTFLVTPAVEGKVTVKVAAGVAMDAASNGNTAAVNLECAYDLTPPTVTLTAPAGSRISGPFTVTAKFSEAVNGFADGDVTVTNGTVGAVTGSGDTYTFLVTPTADGPVTVQLAADVAADAASNGNAAATDLVLTYDHTLPTVTLTTASGIFTNEPFTVTAKFSEAVSGLADGDVTVTNGTAGAITGSGDTYAFLVTPTADGPVTVQLAADVAADAAGNGNAAATDMVLTYDHTPPTVTLTTASGIFTNEPFTVTAKFSEFVSGFADGDVTVTNGTVGAITGSGDTYAFLVTPTADGPVTVKLAADVAADAAGNGNAAATDMVLTYDHTAPTVTLTTSAGIFTNEPFTVTAKFSEAVSGLADGDVTVTNGTADAITGSGDTYALLVTPTADGPVTVQLAADVAADAAGNGNAAATDLSLTYDHTSPTVTLTTTVGIFTNEPFTVTAKFSEAVSGFADGDVTVTNGTVGAITGSGDTYALLVTPTADGPVTVQLAADVAADTAGNGNAAATDLSLTYDHTSPTVTLTTLAGIFTNEPFMVTAKFSEAVSGLADGDVTVTNGTVGAITGSGDTYALLVTPTADGPVTVQLAADVAADAAGNGNAAATDLSLTYDHTAPTVTLTTSAGIFTNEPFTVTAKFSEAVSGFADGDVAVTNGTAGAITGSGDTYALLVTPTADGPVTVRLAADVAADAAGNGNAAATDLSLTYDHTSPTVTLTTLAGIFTNEPFMVTAKFSESVSGLADGDVTVTNGTVSTITGSGDTYALLVTPTADGPVTVQLAADVAADAAGNGNAAATDLSLTYDHTSPTVTLTTLAGIFTNEPFTVTAKFSEFVSGFADGDVTVTNGTVGAITGSGDTYTFQVTPIADGPVTVKLAADVAADTAGNGNTAATDLSLTYDHTSPTVTLTTPAGIFINESFTVTAKFSEAVSGLADGDVTVTNGTAGAITGSGDTYALLVTPTADGPVTVRLAADVAADAAGNGNAAATDLSLTYDHTSPTVTLTTLAGIFTNEPFMVTAKFSESVSGLADGDVTVTNGTVSTITGSGDTYALLVTPTADGPVTVQLAADVAADAAGNGNAAATDLSLTYDHTSPTVTLTTLAGIFTNEPFTVTAKFSEFVSGFADGDVTVTNGTVGAITGSGDTYTFQVTPIADGPVTVKLAADVAADTAGNGNTAATDLSLTYDHTSPTVTLTTPAGIFTNEPFMVTAKFSESVSGLADGDMTVTNGTVSTITGSGDTYTFLVTPTADGPVTVQLAADVAADAAGNGNAAATDLSLTYDHTSPAVTLTTPAGSFTNEPFTVTAKFSEAVSGFADGDVTVTNGTVGAVTGSGDTYAFLVTPTADGPVTVKLAADVAADAAGNGNAAATDLALTYDHTAPTVTLTTPAGSFTNEPFTVTAKFSEAVSGFADGDVTVTNGTVGAVTGSGDTYAFLVTPTADGPVTVQLAADVAADAASNGNAAATDLVLTYDHTVPTVTLTTTAGIFINEPFTVTAKFSEFVSGFADGDVTVTNGTVGAITGSGDTYTFLVTPTADGPVTVQLAADVAADAAGNGNAAATDLSLTYDHTAPTVTLTTSAGIFTNEPFTVTAKFSEFVSGFADGDVTVTNGTVGAITGSGDTYALLVTPTTDGPVTVQLAADVAADAAGNGNAASTDLVLTYDHTPPTVTLTTASGIFTNEPFTVTAKFSEEVSGFTDGDVTVANGTAGALAGSGDTFTFPITPTADGQVTVSVYGDAAVDAAGNGNAAATDLSLTYDHTAPTVTLTTTAGNFTNEPFTVTAKFSEEVSGFTNGDITVANGTAGALAGSGDTFTFPITPTADGQVTVSVYGDAAVDAAGNGNMPATDLVLTYDHTPPTVTLTTTAGNFTNEPFTVTAKFSEEVSGFTDGDVTVTNSTAGAITGSGDAYTFLVTPEADGLVTVAVYGDVAMDASGNGNIAGAVLSLIYDRTAASIAFSPNGSPDPAATVETTVVVTDEASSNLKSLKYMWTQSTDAPEEHAVGWSDFTTGDTIRQTEGEGIWYLHIHAVDETGNVNDRVSEPFVLDNTAPSIELIGDNPFYVPQGESYLEPGAASTDNFDGALPASAIMISGDVDTEALGSYEIHYAARDRAGNEATVTRSVYVYDGDMPIIHLNGSNPLIVAVGSVFADPGATAWDKQEGDLTGAITVMGAVYTAGVSWYHLDYRVKDNAGNAAPTVTRAVYVIAPPVITLLGSSAITMTAGEAFSDPGAHASDDYYGDLTGAIAVTGTVDIHRPGLYTLQYNVQNPIGQRASATRTVTVVSNGDSGGSDDSSDGGGGDPSGPVPKDNGQADLSATADILINGIRAAVRQKTEMSADGLTVVRLLLTAEQVAGAFASDDGEAVMNIEGLGPAVKISMPAAALQNVLKTRSEASIRVIVNGSSLLLQLKAIEGLPETSTVTVTIAAASDARNNVLKEALEKLETTALIDRPITFALDADGRPIAGVGYTERTIPLPEAVESNKTTAVWIDATGGLHFAPSIFTGAINGNKPAVTIRSPYDGLYTVIRSDKSFADMNGHWAQQEIELLANKRIVEGQPDGQFAPNDSITRAEFAELLVRALGLPEATSQPSFSDVDSASWFSGAVGAARQAGLIDGYGEGTFQPDAHITREQMAVMIGRALAFAGKSPEADSGMLQTFADGSDIAGWAADAAAQAAGTGIIQGMAGAAFAPEEEASRAQSAVMLQRMLAYLQFINN